MIVYDKLFIGGRWTKPTTTELLDIRSPHDRSLVGRAAQASPADVDQAVSAAREAFDHGPWPRMTPGERQADPFGGVGPASLPPSATTRPVAGGPGP